MLCFLGKRYESAKICENLRLGSVCPLRLVPSSAPWDEQRHSTVHLLCRSLPRILRWRAAKAQAKAGGGWEGLCFLRKASSVLQINRLKIQEGNMQGFWWSENHKTPENRGLKKSTEIGHGSSAPPWLHRNTGKQAFWSFRAPQERSTLITSWTVNFWVFCHFPRWTVAQGSSISWVAKLKGDKNAESFKWVVAKLKGDQTSSFCRKWVVAKLQGDRSASQSSMELCDPWISGPLRGFLIWEAASKLAFACMTPASFVIFAVFKGCEQQSPWMQFRHSHRFRCNPLFWQETNAPFTKKHGLHDPELRH